MPPPVIRIPNNRFKLGGRGKMFQKISVHTAKGMIVRDWKFVPSWWYFMKTVRMSIRRCFLFRYSKLRLFELHWIVLTLQSIQNKLFVNSLLEANFEKCYRNIYVKRKFYIRVCGYVLRTNLLSIYSVIFVFRIYTSSN